MKKYEVNELLLSSIIAYNIHKYRMGRRLTLSKLARRAGISVKIIKEAEEQIKIPKLIHLIKIAKVLGVSIFQLLEGIETL